MRWLENAEMAAARRREQNLGSTGSELQRKYWLALVLYAVLAALSWFTLDGKIAVGGKLVELRLVPLVIIGGLALRTMVAMQAEKIRRDGKKGGS